MERWNELIAGYVLENLTDEEAQELSAILRANPHLQLEFSRRRKTATMSRAQLGERTVESLDAGAEGWADTVHHAPNDVQPIRPVFPEKKPLLESVAEATPVSAANAAALRASFQRYWMAKSAVFQRTNLLSWLMALVLIGVGIDNWRVRRLLAIAQERILQLELSAEYRPGSAE